MIDESGLVHFGRASARSKGVAYVPRESGTSPLVRDPSGLDHIGLDFDIIRDFLQQLF